MGGEIKQRPSFLCWTGVLPPSTGSFHFLSWDEYKVGGGVQPPTCEEEVFCMALVLN